MKPNLDQFTKKRIEKQARESSFGPIAKRIVKPKILKESEESEKEQ